MPVTSNLKKQVDLPIYEWMRPIPVATAATSAMTAINTPSNRFIYYIGATFLYRYDTFADSWHQLANPPLTVANLVEVRYNPSLGHYGQAIGPGTGNNTIEMAGFCGEPLVGYKIRILSGKGAGQERTITNVSDSIVHDRGVVTTASTSTVTDASTGVNAKQWRINQYKGYQVRIDHGAGINQIREILSNTANGLVIYDTSWHVVTPWWGAIFPATTSSTAATFTNYQIESHIVTVDSPWEIQPDASSKFVILSGGIVCVTSVGSAPFFYIQYYDVISDVWYQKSTQSNLLPTTLGTDISFETFNEAIGPIASGVSTSTNLRALYNTGVSMETGRYANFELRIKNGPASGQVRTILTNTSSGFYLVKDFDVLPNQNSNYEIYPDVGKIYLIGNGAATMYQYSIDSDQWTPSKQFDYGVARNISYFSSGNEPIGISSITRNTNGIFTINTIPISGGTGYLRDQILTIAGGTTNGTARISSVGISGQVLSVELESLGAGYTSTGGKTTTVSPLGGAGCAIEITSTGDIGVVTTAIAHNAKLGDNIYITGCTGATHEVYNGYKTVMGLTSSTVFNISGVFPSTTALSDAQSTTRLVDVNKNWISGEHIGKLVQITSSVPPNSTAQTRRISDNTRNSLTFATATAPVNGTSKYVIHDVKPFATERGIGARRLNVGRAGIATGGTNTSLVDSTKNWDPFYWSNTTPAGAGNTGRKVRIVAGTGSGSEMIILSNSNNTLFFAPQSFVPDATSVYVIMENFGTATGGSATTLIDTTQNWPTNYWVNKRVKFTSGTGQSNEYTITANTQTTLTFAAGTAPDTTTTYVILEGPAKGAGIHIDYITNASDSALNHRYLHFFYGGVTALMSRYNIMTEQIDIFTPFPFTETLTTGSMYAYDGGDRIYFTKDATGRIMYYDIVKNIIVPCSTVPYGMSTAIIGNRMEIIQTEDGLKYLYIMRHSSQEFWRTLLYL